MSTDRYASTLAKWNKSGVDFFTAVSAGKVPGWSVIHKFGANGSLGTAIEDIWSVGGIYSFPQTSVPIEVVSTSVDDVNLTGTGAWTIKLQGLDVDCVSLEEEILLNGTTAVQTVNSFMRITRAFVFKSGTYRTGAAGDISIQISGGGAVQAEILRTAEDGTVWNFGQTQLGRYTVPYGKTAFLHSIHVNNESAKLADVVIFQHPDIGGLVAPYCTSKIFKSFSGLDGHDKITYNTPHRFPALTDIYARAKLTSGTAGKVSIDFELLIFDGVL